jgi:phosphoribosyl-ATP pyrophosphohydrolase/phosphoribosyl-AMP cyclohydrolase
MDTQNYQFDDKGLLPVIVQNIHSGKVLMLGYANAEALEKSHQTGLAHFWSRSRKKLWKKGEESGNILQIKAIKTDCDRDAVLYLVQPTGNTCHTGAESCFFHGDKQQTDSAFLYSLEKTIQQRKESMKKDSYVYSLFSDGIDRIAQKVGEEAVETVIASKNEDRDDFLNESADLLFHLLILLREKDLNLSDVIAVLKNRSGEELY